MGGCGPWRGGRKEAGRPDLEVTSKKEEEGGLTLWGWTGVPAGGRGVTDWTQEWVRWLEGLSPVGTNDRRRERE